MKRWLKRKCKGSTRDSCWIRIIVITASTSILTAVRREGDEDEENG